MFNILVYVLPKQALYVYHFEKPSKCFPKCTILHSHQWRVGVLISPHPHNILLVYLFDSSHPSGCDVESHFAFDFHLPSDKGRWAPFHELTGHLYVFFGELFVQIPCPFLIGLFVFLLLSIHSAYKSFIRYMFYKYYCLVGGLSFHLLYDILWRRKVFNADEVQFIHLLLHHCAFSIVSEKLSSNSRS